MNRHKPIRPIRYTPGTIIELYLDTKFNGGDFWEQVHWLQGQGLVKMNDAEVKKLLEGCQGYTDQRQYDHTAYVDSLPKQDPGFPDYSRPQPSRRPSDKAQDTPPLKPIMRAGELLRDVASKYGWVFNLRKREWTHPILRLVIQAETGGKLRQKPVLLVGDSRRPCIAIIPDRQLDLYGDVVAAYMMSAMFDPTFSVHIARYDSEYAERLVQWKMKGGAQCLESG